MTGIDLLRDLSAAGISVTAAGDRLHVVAPTGMLTADIRRTLTENKLALLAQLAAEDGLRAHLHALAAGAGIPAGVVCALSGGTLAGMLGTPDDMLVILLDYYHRTMIVRGELPAIADATLAGAIIDVATPGAVGKLAMPGAAGGDP